MESEQILKFEKEIKKNKIEVSKLRNKREEIIEEWFYADLIKAPITPILKESADLYGKKIMKLDKDITNRENEIINLKYKAKLESIKHKLDKEQYQTIHQMGLFDVLFDDLYLYSVDLISKDDLSKIIIEKKKMLVEKK